MGVRKRIKKTVYNNVYIAQHPSGCYDTIHGALQAIKSKKNLDMENIRLRKATSKDSAIVVDFDYRLNKDEHTKLNREEKITKAISNDECFLILADKTTKTNLMSSWHCCSTD